MTGTKQIELYNLFIHKLNLSDTEARQVIEFIEESREVDQKQLLTQADKTEIFDRIGNLRVELTSRMYMTSFIQYIAIIGSMIAIFKFMLDK